MAARTDTPRPNGSGSIADTADLDASLAAASDLSLEGPRPTHSEAVAALTLRLNRLTQEIREVRQRGEQLEATLAKRNRRVQQLIGERDRLASLLAARDAELLKVTRELGVLSERAAPVARRSPGLLAAAGAVLDKFRHTPKAPERAKAPNSPPAAAERPSTERPLLPWVKDGPPKPVLGVVVFDLSEAEIENILDIVERHCKERDLTPLLLTDNDAFQLFRGRRVLFEFLPARADQERFAAELDWRLFTLRRLALIRRKWQPVRVIAFGRQAVEIVQLWLDSPFEPTPIPASLHGRSEAAGPAWGETLQSSGLAP